MSLPRAVWDRWLRKGVITQVIYDRRFKQGEVVFSGSSSGATVIFKKDASMGELIEKPAVERKLRPEKEKKKLYPKGYSAVSLVRWMAKRGFSLDEALEGLKLMNLNLKKSSIKIMLAAGRKAKCGKLAEVSKEDEMKLMSLRLKR